jgi:anti-anti-sigma factor
MLSQAPLRAETVIRLSTKILRDDTFPRGLTRVATAAGSDALHLDLGAVELLTASGLGRLVGLHHELRNAGVELALVNVPGRVHEVFEVTRLTEVLDIRPEEP